jgi:hypothetical protein
MSAIRHTLWKGEELKITYTERPLGQAVIKVGWLAYR